MQLQFLLEEAALVTIFKTARRIATNLISSKTTETYSLAQHVADEASSSQVAVVLEAGTQHVRGRHSPRELLTTYR